MGEAGFERVKTRHRVDFLAMRLAQLIEETSEHAELTLMPGSKPGREVAS